MSRLSKQPEPKQSSPGILKPIPGLLFFVFSFEIAIQQNTR